MKSKILIAVCAFALCGCANISQSRQNVDGTIEHIKITSLFSKSVLTKFKGNHTTKTTSSGVSFDAGDTDAKIEEMGAAFGAAAASAMKKGVGVP